MTRVAAAVLLLALFGVAACGDDPEPAPALPPWAKVAPEQIAEAKKHGVPVAFENDLGMRFVLIPAGTFMMGSPEDEEGRHRSKPQHEVFLSRPFYMQVMEVCNKAYRRHQPNHDAEELAKADMTLRSRTPSRVTTYPHTSGPELNEEQQPVTWVSWQEAKAFAGWVTAQFGGRLYRLPTEAEWEYACRAGTTTRTAFGETLTHEQANIGRNRFDTGPDPRGASSPAEVGNYSPNTWGLYDMHGNVMEWCADWFGAYGPDRAEGPTGPQEGTGRVIRGGSARTLKGYVGSAERWMWPPEYKTGRAWVGFRLVSPLPKPSK